VKSQSPFNKRSEAEATADPPTTADAILREAERQAALLIEAANLRVSLLSKPTQPKVKSSHQTANPQVKSSSNLCTFYTKKFGTPSSFVAL
jgi:hypothetical protein